MQPLQMGGTSFVPTALALIPCLRIHGHCIHVGHCKNVNCGAGEGIHERSRSLVKRVRVIFEGDNGLRGDDVDVRNFGCSDSEQAVVQTHLR